LLRAKGASLCEVAIATQISVRQVKLYQDFHSYSVTRGGFPVIVG
jgi:hypothetical protein